VTQIKSAEKDGYASIQWRSASAHQPSQQILAGHLAKRVSKPAHAARIPRRAEDLRQPEGRRQDRRRISRSGRGWTSSTVTGCVTPSSVKTRVMPTLRPTKSYRHFKSLYRTLIFYVDSGRQIELHERVTVLSVGSMMSISLR